jgi:toxin ParE1/3/4
VKSKPIVLRERADQDITDAANYYLSADGAELAMRFVSALEASFSYLEKHGDAGSPRYSVELALPGVRHWIVRGFPFLIFYVSNDSHIDVWRILHAQRDMPSWLQDDGDGNT